MADDWNFYIFSPLKAISDKIEDHRIDITQIKSKPTKPSVGRCEARPNSFCSNNNCTRHKQSTRQGQKISRLWFCGWNRIDGWDGDGEDGWGWIVVVSVIVYQQQQRQSPSPTRPSPPPQNDDFPNSSFKRQQQHVLHDNQQQQQQISPGKRCSSLLQCVVDGVWAGRRDQKWNEIKSKCVWFGISKGPITHSQMMFDCS